MHRSEVTTKRGLASPLVHSALPITRRLRLQLSSVRHWKSLKRRAGALVCAASRSAAASWRLILATRRSLRASPNTYSTPLSSHQAISCSRAKPLSARRMICTSGQCSRIWAAMLDLLLGSGRRVDVGAAQLGRQQVATAKDIQWQVTIAIVVAVEEAALLVAVQRIVGRIEIEDDALGRRGMRLQEQRHEQALDPARIMADLVVAA